IQAFFPKLSPHVLNATKKRKTQKRKKPAETQPCALSTNPAPAPPALTLRGLHLTTPR
ncbi:hypothetical protein P7K49_032418, partial [Saguinus oedipus]